MATRSSRPRPAGRAPHQDVPDLFERAVHAHVAGEVDAAQALYERVLERSPRHPEALNNAGAILAGRGQRDAATDLLLRAVEAAPQYGEALNNLGLLANEVADFSRSRDYFRRAIESDPSNPDWLNNFANASVELNRFEEAVGAFDRAIALRPAEAGYWSNRGIALRGLRRPEDAIASFERALAIDPRHVNALSNMGVVYKEQRRFDDALDVYGRALALEPGNAALHANAATVYEMIGNHHRMRELAERAVAIDPAYAEGYVLLANHELECGCYDAAEALYWKAVALDPNSRNGNWNLAIIWLLKGDFERGWRQFAWRKRLQSVLVESGEYDGPEWDGSSLDGRTILLVTEQGMGDAIQFVRYAESLKRAGAGRVIVECTFPIAPLLATAPGVDLAVARGLPLPPYDTWASLMSLPGLVGTTLETIPHGVPYLFPETREAAEVVVAPPGTVKVGIVWAGNPIHQRDYLRSVELSRFQPLLDVPGTRFFSLQKGAHGEHQLRAFGENRIVDLAPRLEDFADTAAAIARLDLVITVDTSVAHLAGAMGKPTWIMLPHVPDFRWLLDRSDSPWYPSARLFRQSVPRCWDDVFAAMEAELRSVVQAVPHSQGDPPATTGEPLVKLVAASTSPDGRPRFELAIPLSRLADPEWFASWQAELVGGGYQRLVRDFWDESAQAVGMVIDLTPGVGLMALSLLNAARPPRQLVLVEPSVQDAEWLRALVRSQALGDRVRVVADAGEALEWAIASGVATAGIHAGDPAALGAFAVAWRSERNRPPLEIVTCAAGAALPGDTWRLVPQWDGLAGFSISRIEGDVTLDPLAETSGDVDAAWLSARVLEVLSTTSTPAGDPPERGQAVTTASTACPTGGTAVAAAPRALEIGIDWELRTDTGWGVYGINLALELIRRDVLPGIFAMDERTLTPYAAWRLDGLLRSSVPRRVAVGDVSRPPLAFDGVLLRGLGNDFAGGPVGSRVQARRDVGVIFFEDPSFDPVALERARSLDLIVAGSSWNAEVLRDLGLSGVATAFQGIDPTVFHPAPRSGQLADRFVVFSGGKLEYRKGQDIVVAAFRRFRERHPEALLVTAWYNAWPQLMVDLDLAGHVSGAPRHDGTSLLVREWLAANGLPPDATLDLGRQPNALMGAMVREADVAVFPNRCEGGTNLVAMECMAAGVPTIVSANTGHLDLVATGGCQPLGEQRAVRAPSRFFRSTEGWGESSVDEIVDALERLWSDRQAGQAIAARGAGVMQDWTWSRQVGRLLDALAPVFPGV